MLEHCVIIGAADPTTPAEPSLLSQTGGLHAASLHPRGSLRSGKGSNQLE